MPEVLFDVTGNGQFTGGDKVKVERADLKVLPDGALVVTLTVTREYTLHDVDELIACLENGTFRSGAA